MSNLANVTISFTFATDPAPTNKVNAGQLDTQLNALATAQNATKAALDVITGSDNTLAAQSVGLAQLKAEVTAAMGIVGTLYNQLVLGSLIVGQSTTVLTPTSPEKLLVDYGSTTSTTGERVKAVSPGFFQLDVMNGSNAVGAQSGVCATADVGTDLAFFVFAGMNNSGAPLVAPYNIGAALDSNFMGYGNDMYVCNGSTTKDIIFSCGKVASPYWNNWARLTNAGLWQTDCARKKNTLSVVTAAGTTVGTALDHVVVFTGGTTHTYTMPACTTGRELILINRSTATVTLNRAGADTINSGTTTALTTGQMGHFHGNASDFAGRVF